MKYTRLLFLVLSLGLAGGGLFAQQLSLFTQYRENATLINPAAMESDFLTFGYNMQFGVNYRKQWVGLQNSPETQSLRFSYIRDRSRGSTYHAGAYILNDQTGPTGYTGIYGRIGTVISRDPEDGGLSLGLSLGYVGYRVRSSELFVQDLGDPITGVDQTQSHPDVGFGAYYYKYLNRDNLVYGGVSVPQLLGFDITYQDENGDFSVQRLRHYYGMLGWYLFTSDESFLELSSWIKYVEGAPLNADLTLRYQLPSAPYIGAGFGRGLGGTYDSGGNFHFEAGLNFGQNYGADTNFRVGYGFDYSFSSFGPSAGGTHEIQLSVALDR